MGTTTTRHSPEVRERAVRMVLEQQQEHSSQWAARFDNQRLLESIGHVPPAEYERDFHRLNEAQAMAAGLTHRSLRKSRGGSQIIVRNALRGALRGRADPILRLHSRAHSREQARLQRSMHWLSRQRERRLRDDPPMLTRVCDAGLCGAIGCGGYSKLTEQGRFPDYFADGAR